MVLIIWTINEHVIVDYIPSNSAETVRHGGEIRQGVTDNGAGDDLIRIWLPI